MEDQKSNTNLLDLQIDFAKKHKNLKGQYYCPIVECDWTHQYNQKKVIDHLQTHKTHKTETI